jgi:hypothetical protein
MQALTLRKKKKPLAAELEGLIEELRLLWPARSRGGAGFEDSLQRLRHTEHVLRYGASADDSTLHAGQRVFGGEKESALARARERDRQTDKSERARERERERESEESKRVRGQERERERASEKEVEDWSRLNERVHELQGRHVEPQAVQSDEL